MFEVYEISNLFYYTVWVMMTFGILALVGGLNRKERFLAFVSGGAAASAFFSYLLMQVGLGGDLTTELLVMISAASGSFSAYLYHKAKTEGGY